MGFAPDSRWPGAPNGLFFLGSSSNWLFVLQSLFHFQLLTAAVVGGFFVFVLFFHFESHIFFGVGIESLVNETKCGLA